MHTDLSPHLHTDKCNEIIRLWRQCCVDHSVSKLFGKCNPNYNQMVKCLKEERLARKERNAQFAKERQAKVQQYHKEHAHAQKTT